MTRKSIAEYAAAVRARYQAARKAEKGVILDEFCRVTGFHRKAAIRLLWHPTRGTGRRRGRPRTYGSEVVVALEQLWQAADHICGKRLAPFLPELLQMLERAGELHLAPTVRTQVQQLSAATIDRLLAPARQRQPRRPFTQSRAESAIKALVPIRTFSEWQGVAPGSFQADLVAHCGESTQGHYLNTLVAVDVASSWTELEAVWGKTQQRVGTGMHHVRQQAPVPMRELHFDNGGEFLNHLLYPWCQREGIAVTRGRAYKKNDQAYVEQRNGEVVRKVVGYDRYSSKAAYEQLHRLYALVRLYVNFCQPVRKLVGKERLGAKVIKRFDQAKTPYQRLLVADVLDEATRAALERQYQRLNPLRLRQQMQAELEVLWRLAERPTTSSPESIQ